MSNIAISLWAFAIDELLVMQRQFDLVTETKSKGALSITDITPCNPVQRASLNLISLAAADFSWRTLSVAARCYWDKLCSCFRRNERCGHAVRPDT